MADIGVLIARECDKFLLKSVEEHRQNFLSDMVKSTRSLKARLLHYFPKADSSHEDEIQDSWCGWHLDHSCLTVLTAALYLDETSRPFQDLVVSDSDDSGLYIRNRGGKIVKVPD